MMMRTTHGVPRPISLATLCMVCYAAPFCQVIAPANRAMERSAAWCYKVVWRYCRMFARLVGIKYTDCVHILQGHNDVDVRCLKNMRVYLKNTWA
jgi:hypothetical protein